MFIHKIFGALHKAGSNLGLAMLLRRLHHVFIQNRILVQHLRGWSRACDLNRNGTVRTQLEKRSMDVEYPRAHIPHRYHDIVSTQCFPYNTTHVPQILIRDLLSAKRLYTAMDFEASRAFNFKRALRSRYIEVISNSA